MVLEDIAGYVVELLDGSKNRVSPEKAISPELAGMRMYDFGAIGSARANDELFREFTNPGVIGPHFMPPREWMPEAASVVSVFFKVTDRVIKSMEESPYWPSPEWLHTCIEGQAFITWAMLSLADEIKRLGAAAMVPTEDARFSVVNYNKDGKKFHGASYTSNWSERHVAYACGLGTFGLSKGIITKVGTPGRFGSVVTSLCLPKAKREYGSPYEFCVMCGKCAENCLAGAITKEHGKDHSICAAFIGRTKERFFPRYGCERFSPRYGCGRCQISVPCMSGPPRRA